MTRAVVPTEIPALPEGASQWARSTKRAGGMFHAHTLGMTVCGQLRLDRHHSEEAFGLGQLKYYGVCPRCMAKVPH